KIGEQLGHIRMSATRMTDLVDDLITDAMMDAADIAVRNEPVDIAALLIEIAESNRALAERKNQTIELNAPPFRMANCDPDRLREAIDNLLSNAIKYSVIGGHITLAMAPEGEGTVIRVTDEGAGLSQEDISRLFGRFQRLSS